MKQQDEIGLLRGFDRGTHGFGACFGSPVDFDGAHHGLLAHPHEEQRGDPDQRGRDGATPCRLLIVVCRQSPYGRGDLRVGGVPVVDIAEFSPDESRVFLEKLFGATDLPPDVVERLFHLSRVEDESEGDRILVGTSIIKLIAIDATAGARSPRRNSAIARAFTGKPWVLKVAGGWHGASTDLSFSVKAPFCGAEGPGLLDPEAQCIDHLHFNDIEASKKTLSVHRDHLAAIIVVAVDVRIAASVVGEAAIRAYDPCLSCATHSMGQMPLILEVFDADGNVVAEHVKDPT